MKQKNSLTDTFLLGGDRFTLPKCMLCRNFIDDEKEIPTCTAFPDGIPHDIMWDPDDKERKDGIKFEVE